MTDYTQYALNVSPGQAKKLANGMKVRLKPDQIGNGVNLPLTATQVKKLEKSKAAGKGSELVLSPAQISQISQSGEGIFGDIFRAVKGGVKKVGMFLANKGIDVVGREGPKYLDKGFDMAGRFAQGQLDRLGPGTASDLVSQGQKMGQDFSRAQLAALLAGLRGTVNGSGLFELTQSGEGILAGEGIYVPGEQSRRAR